MSVALVVPGLVGWAISASAEAFSDPLDLQEEVGETLGSSASSLRTPAQPFYLAQTGLTSCLSALCGGFQASPQGQEETRLG